jgi:hypothetical protein
MAIYVASYVEVTTDLCFLEPQQIVELLSRTRLLEMLYRVLESFHTPSRSIFLD